MEALLEVALEGTRRPPRPPPPRLERAASTPSPTTLPRLPTLRRRCRTTVEAAPTAEGTGTEEDREIMTL